MFLEVKGRPKVLTVQKLTKANKWKDIAVINILAGVDFDTACNILESCPERWKNSYRLIIRSEKSGKELQVLSDLALNFYHRLKKVENNPGRYLMVRGLDSYFIGASNLMLVANNGNPHCLGWNDYFVMFIRKNGGIAKATLRKQCKEDGFLNTWDIRFVNGNKITVSELKA